jgi:hypothetical protein
LRFHHGAAWRRSGIRDEYDFTRAEQGKFYRDGTRIQVPIYLGPDLQVRLERLARTEGNEVGEYALELIAREVERRERSSK